MEKTGIIWTEARWNFVRFIHKETKKVGWYCQKKNAGCKYCYAETLNRKFGNLLPFNVASASKVDFDISPMNIPFKWKEPTVCFVNSMTDFFLPLIPDWIRDKAIDVMEQTPQHEYQVLTKHPDQMLRYSLRRKLPPNFWAGVTIPSQRQVNEGDLALLQRVEAEIRFISAEPLLEPINFTPRDLAGIHWIIVGGESGNHLWKDDECKARGLVYPHRERGQKVKWLPREDRMDWVRNIRDTCKQNGVHFFFKQWGGAYPEAAGRLLDGRTWNESPRYAGGKDHLDNDYLKQIEAEIGNDYGATQQTLGL